MAEKLAIDGKEQPIVKLLEAYIQSGNINFLIGSGASLPAVSVAGNIEKEINDLLEKAPSSANLKALEFVEDIEGKTKDISNDPEEVDIATTLSFYLDLLATIDQLLFERKNILLPRQANLFTTNYDLFIEHAANQIPSLILNDGFDRSSAIETDFLFMPERFFDRTYRSSTIYGREAEVPTINLLKLHGSLSWARGEDGIRFRRDYPEALDKDQRKDDALVSQSLEGRALILPNLRKFGETLLDRTYYDLLRMFSNAMERENSLLISFGFSFEDEHILDITKRALRNPTSQLIIFAYSVESADGYLEKFSKHRNVAVIKPAEGSNIGFDVFNETLKAVIPTRAKSHE